MKELPIYAYKRPEEMDHPCAEPHPVVVVGAGVTGLTMALDLARRGVPVVVLDDDNTVGVRGLASRGMVWAQRSLDILDRLRAVGDIVGTGVHWNVGRVLCKDQAVASFTLQDQPDMRHNGFVNLQQYYLESFLVDALVQEPLAELRWLNRVTGIEPGKNGPATLEVETPDGPYRVSAQWVIACDGANSPICGMLGLRPRVHDRTEDRWVIIDIVLRNTTWPEERWTWLDAQSNHGRAVWRHKMADDTWRLDFQLRPEEDAAQAVTEASMRQRVWDLLGEKVEFDIAWHGVWAYRHECLDNLRHHHVLFAGDSAHLLAPFGARGGNGGIQDADNLGWKLALVLAGKADESLLDTYSVERRHAAMENIRQARRSARFVYPAPGSSAAMWRDAIIALAPTHETVARMVNTGRLCMPAVYPPSSLVRGAHAHAGRALPNIVLRREDGLTLYDVAGPWFTVLVFGDALPAGAPAGQDQDALVKWVAVGPLCDERGRAALAHQLGVALDGQAWLLRPDQHVMAASAPEVQDPDALLAWVAEALGRASALSSSFQSFPEASSLPKFGDASHVAFSATA